MSQDVYPISRELADRLSSDGLLGTLGQYALDYVGEYEHGSVDIDALLTAEQRAENVMSDDNDELSWLLSKQDLVRFAANVLHDYLLSVSAQEGT